MVASLVHTLRSISRQSYPADRLHVLIPHASRLTRSSQPLAHPRPLQVDFVQNSWKSPTRDATLWDVSDILQLAGHGVRSIVSVSHVFTTGPMGSLYPDYAQRWATYHARLAATGALEHVAFAYPSDEPDLRMTAATLGAITAAIKASQPPLPVLLTLSNVPFNVTSGELDYPLVTTHLEPTDIVSFDIYSSGAVYWAAMKAKLDILASFTSARHLSMAVIPDSTIGTFAALGAAGNNVLNDQFYQYVCRGEEERERERERERGRERERERE